MGGAHVVNVHLAQVFVPALAFTIYGAFSAVHLQAGGQGHKVLIGRTFLRHCRMVYDGLTGGVTLEIPPPQQLPLLATELPPPSRPPLTPPH
ncbi:MAG: hypothetical protein KIT22_08285 [Verrucomicrobiae bacterium]|nr:hypothetical protein [Verrucomicrobiae bacterium]